MIPDLIGARSFSAFAIGAKQFVVQEAAEMMLSSFVKLSRGLRCIRLSEGHFLPERK